MHKKLHVRTRKWIMEQGVYIKNDRSRMFTALAIEQWPRHVYLPKINHVPAGSLQLNPKIEIDNLSVITTICQQGSLPKDTLQIVEMLSAASCQTSGYIFVTGANNYEQSCVSDELDSEINDANGVHKQKIKSHKQIGKHMILLKPERLTQVKPQGTLYTELRTYCPKRQRNRVNLANISLKYNNLLKVPSNKNLKLTTKRMKMKSII